MRVLFTSQENARRSPMAEALMRFLMPGVEVSSAGLVPAERTDPFTVIALRERNIDLRGRSPLALTAEMLAAADVVVAIGVLAPSSLLPPGSTIEWDVAGLAGQPLEAYRRARFTIEGLVNGLIEDLVTFRRLQMQRKGGADPFASYFPGR